MYAVALVGNLLLLLLILREPSLQQRSSCLLLATLAVADVALSSSTVPLTLSALLASLPKERAFEACLAQMFFTHTSFIAEPPLSWQPWPLTGTWPFATPCTTPPCSPTGRTRGIRERMAWALLSTRSPPPGHQVKPPRTDGEPQAGGRGWILLPRHSRECWDMEGARRALRDKETNSQS
ncbi:hypothetical protein JRQ81_019575 [Phrynocephalus forsythii]|uniref:G-protein coupled receptors family 1 profile domain-containing protein n=1 Tax=Phrynocephalus forsythii TaxID=171643 RepID=A0A9Q1AY39_9SAUR|nr:hypothetical protein JRQ81_019575 [Phrynocephalus forsythii]